jgi:DNA uptake protein ComE-like DNA-binding protein
VLTFLERLSFLWKSPKIILGIFSLATLFYLSSLVIFLFPAQGSSPTAVFPQERVTSLPLKSSENIYVEVVGAVHSPGVYAVSADDRVINALDKAGGFTSLADKQYIIENLHLAEKVTDQQKIVIPFISQSGIFGDHSENKINLNTASKPEIEKLGITDPKVVTKLLDSRPFSSLTDFKKKVKLPQDLIKKITDKIMFD